METLRPASLGEILDRSIQMLKSNFVLFAGIAAFPALATLVRSLAPLPAVADSSGLGAIIGSLLRLGASIALFALAPLAASAKCWAASQVLRGETVSIGSSYSEATSYTARMIGLGIVQTLMGFWPIIPLAIVGAVVARLILGVDTTTAVIIVAILGAIACLPVYARYLLAYPATAIEETTVGDSLSRSVQLGRGNRSKVLFAYLLPTGIGLILLFSGGFVVGLLKRPQGPLAEHVYLFAIADAVWTFLVTLLYEPLASIALTLTYYDMRVRKEGFDVEWMMKQAGLGEAQSALSEPALAEETGSGGPA